MDEQSIETAGVSFIYNTRSPLFSRIVSIGPCWQLTILTNCRLKRATLTTGGQPWMTITSQI